MTSPCWSVTFRILIVEDHRHTLAFLAQLIAKVFTAVVIDRADNVADARNLINARRKEGLPYHLALLDFKLPSDVGRQDEVDLSLCGLLKSDRVPIIHFTGWSDDPLVKAHMQKVHPKDELRGVPVTLIRKTVTGQWAKQILALIAPYHRWKISDMLRHRLEVVLGEGLSDNGNAADTRSHESAAAGGRGCGTHALLQLYDDIVNNWTILEPGLKKEISGLFAVCKLNGEEKRLSFFPLEDQ